jgi:hypothetical protein
MVPPLFSIRCMMVVIQGRCDEPKSLNVERGQLKDGDE